MITLFSKKILVVDDEAEALNALSNILRRDKYEVFSTTKGREAVELAKENKPDLIILDIVMPDLSGDSVAAILSEDPSTANIPIIFLTGLLSKEEVPPMEKIKRHYVVAKPVTGREVLDMVKKVLSTQGR